jgi:hypothetical protein
MSDLQVLYCTEGGGVTEALDAHKDCPPRSPKELLRSVLANSTYRLAKDKFDFLLL